MPLEHTLLEMLRPHLPWWTRFCIRCGWMQRFQAVTALPPILCPRCSAR